MGDDNSTYVKVLLYKLSEVIVQCWAHKKYLVLLLYFFMLIWKFYNYCSFC